VCFFRLFLRSIIFTRGKLHPNALVSLRSFRNTVFQIQQTLKSIVADIIHRKKLYNDTDNHRQNPNSGRKMKLIGSFDLTLMTRIAKTPYSILVLYLMNFKDKMTHYPHNTGDCLLTVSRRKVDYEKSIYVDLT